MSSLREALESAIEAQENEPIEPQEPIEQIEAQAEPESQPVVEPQGEPESEPESKPRDESGKFKAKESNDYESSPEPVEAKEPVDDVRPSTWKKEYLPLWDKARKGEPMTADEGRKLTDYLNQREQEYKKGVSTYKAEAERAKSLQEAINPFIPELQSNNISPEAWINNLGRAHVILTKAPYHEKVAMFHRLAGEYGIQFDQTGAVVQQNLDPYAQQLMAQLEQVNQEVGTIKSRFQQEEDARLDAEIARFKGDKENYPYFEELQSEMAQILAAGRAEGLQDAYAKAMRFNDDIWGKEQERLLDQARKDALKQAQLQKAKSAAVSVKSTTPSGKTSDGVDTKDRRAVIGSAFENIATSRV